MHDNEALIAHMKSRGILKSPTIIKAFREVDRKFFVPDDFRQEQYLDIPLGIGEGQTISQPSTVAFMLELLDVHRGDKVLDIGSGSGYTTALLASIVGEKGSVLGLERVPKLIMIGRKNLSLFHFPWAKIEAASDTLGREEETFDAILVSASAKSLPQALLEQLRLHARLVIPIKESIFLFERVSQDEVKAQEFSGFRFVPLII